MVPRIICWRMVKVDIWPVVGIVTGVALFSGYKVIGRFSLCLWTIMTTRTWTNNSVVIKVRWDPGYIGMTFFTFSVGLHVSTVFACCDWAVMTATASASHSTMIKSNIIPTCRHMTIIAGITASDVITWFTQSDYIVMTWATGAVDRGMIDLCYRHPRIS